MLSNTHLAVLRFSTRAARGWTGPHGCNRRVRPVQPRSKVARDFIGDKRFQFALVYVCGRRYTRNTSLCWRLLWRQATLPTWAGSRMLAAAVQFGPSLCWTLPWRHAARPLRAGPWMPATALKAQAWSSAVLSLPACRRSPPFALASAHFLTLLHTLFLRMPLTACCFRLRSPFGFQSCFSCAVHLLRLPSSSWVAPAFPADFCA